MSKDKIVRTFTWHCPVCGATSTGVQDDHGFCKAECSVCHRLTVYKMMGRRCDDYRVYASEEDMLKQAEASG